MWDLLWAILLAFGPPLTRETPQTTHTATRPAPMLAGHGDTMEALGEGTATWYDDGPGLYAAAGPGLRGRPGWRGSTVRVCGRVGCVVVVLRDWCACPRGTLIDLSPAAFRTLAPLSRGVVSVKVMSNGT